MKNKIVAAAVLALVTTSASAQCRRIEQTRLPDSEGVASIGIACEVGEHLSGIYCNIINGYGFTEQSLSGTGSGRCVIQIGDVSGSYEDEDGNLIEEEPRFEGTPRAQALCCR